jgi:tetratricopeptide (TPR) repeat protein
MDENETIIQTHVDGEEPKKAKKKFFERRSGWIISAVSLMLVILILAAVTGAVRGINDRVSLAETQAAPRIQSQLDGARLDIEEGRYEVALSRLNWILEEMSDFLSEDELSEVGEIYSQTLVMIAQIGTPTPQPTPTAIEPVNTPTPDLRGAQDLYDTANQFMADRAWNDVILTLASLRQKDLSFRTVQVDGMLYIALRNRGIEKILSEGSLEPGIYDLSLAERFAPLDSRAEGIRTWTRLYLTGASYWEINWAQVVFYFEQVYPHVPNLRDGTFMTATDRFRVGAIEYANELAALGDYCLAQEYFERALAISENPEIQPTAQWVAEACASGEEGPPPTELEEVQPTATPRSGLGPTPAPTPTQTETPPDQPTGEPTIEPTTEPTAEPTEDPGGGG